MPSSFNAISTLKALQSSCLGLIGGKWIEGQDSVVSALSLKTKCSLVFPHCAAFWIILDIMRRARHHNHIKLNPVWELRRARLNLSHVQSTALPTLYCQFHTEYPDITLDFLDNINVATQVQVDRENKTNWYLLCCRDKICELCWHDGWSLGRVLSWVL